MTNVHRAIASAAARAAAKPGPVKAKVTEVPGDQMSKAIGAPMTKVVHGYDIKLDRPVGLPFLNKFLPANGTFWANGYTEKLDLKKTDLASIQAGLEKDGVAEHHSPTKQEVAGFMEMVKNAAGKGGSFYVANCYGDRNEGLVVVAAKAGGKELTSFELNKRWDDE